MSYSEEIFCKLESQKYVYITGDFNCNTLVSNISTEEFKNILSYNHYYPLINRPTRSTKSAATLSDNIFVTCQIYLMLWQLDYYMRIFQITRVYFVSIITPYSVKNVFISKRNFSKINILKFTFNIHKETWDCVHYLPVQSAFRRFLGVIVQHFENRFPKLTFTLTYKTRFPWMTPDLFHKICEKNAMYKATLTDSQNKESLIEYKKNKNLLNSQVKNTEILYY